MLKILQKGIPALALAVAGFAAQGQTVLFSENFQGFQLQGYPAGDPCVYTGPAPASNQYNTLDPLVGTFEKDTVYGTLPVKYKFVNAAVNPKCPVRGGTRVNPIIPASPGFVELKNLSSNNLTAYGYFSTSVLPYVSTVKVNVSYTGGTRSSAVLKSIDGIKWDTVSTFGDLVGDTYGTSGIFDIFEKDVMLRFSVYSDLARSVRTKVHDLIVYTEDPTSITNNFMNEGGASIICSNNMIMIKSPENGSAEIVGLDGSIVGSRSLRKGVEESFTVNKSGLYVVRIVANNHASARKVILQ